MTMRNSSRSASSLSSMPAADLKKELLKREQTVRRLIRKRERIASQIGQLDKQIDAFGGVKIRKRPRNDSNLVVALARVLAGNVMSLGQATNAVREAGYQSTSPNFRTIVNQTLINSPRVFKRVSRGRYTAK